MSGLKYPMKSKAVPYAAAAVSAVAWGFSFLFTKNALSYLSMFQLLGYRFIVAAVFMTVLAAVGAIKIRLTKEKLRNMMLVALLQPVLYFMCETVGVNLTNASESGLVIALVPIATSLFSMRLLKERFNPLKWISVGICVGGVALIVLAKGLSSGGGQLLGFAALLGAVLAAGLYNPLSRKASEMCSPMEITFMMMWTGAIVFTATGIVADKGDFGAYFGMFGSWNVMAGVAYLGLICSVVAFFFQNFALSKLESTVIGTFANLVPLISVFAGVAIGGDRLAPLQIAGAALILAGIWGAARGGPAAAKAALPAHLE